MEYKFFKILFIFLSLKSFSQSDKVSYFKKELKGVVTYHLKSDNDGFYISQIQFENDSIKSPILTNCLTGDSFLHSLGLLDTYKYKDEPDSIFCIENTFGIRKTKNIGGIIKIISPFYYTSPTNELLIIFSLKADFICFEDINSSFKDKFLNNRKILVIDKIKEIEQVSSEYLRLNKLKKSEVLSTEFYPKE